MEKRLINCLVVGILLLSNFCFAQKNRFVELTISDTIPLKANKIIYHISLGSQMEFMGMRMGKEEISTGESTTTISDITKLLDGDKFVYNVVETKDYSISAKEIPQSIDVVVGNETELKRLYSLLKVQKGISGKIKDTFYESISLHQDDVYAQLYAKAVKQVTSLAKASNATVGKLISISEIKKEADSSMDMFKLMMKNMPIALEASSLEKNEVINMIFTFELK